MNTNGEAKTTNEDLRNAFEWIESVYEESEKLLHDSADHLKNEHNFRDAKLTLDWMIEESYFRYIASRYLLLPKERNSHPDAVVLNGISFSENTGKEHPRLIIAKIILKDNFEWKRAKKIDDILGTSMYYLYYACVDPDPEYGLFKIREKEKIFLITKPTTEIIQWFEKRKQVKEVISTWVPLASIDKPETLFELLDSAVPFFLKDDKAKLRETVLKLRGEEK